MTEQQAQKVLAAVDAAIMLLMRSGREGLICADSLNAVRPTIFKVLNQQPTPDDGYAEKLRRERDYLVEEYERAAGCGPQGYLHCAMHLFNAITNARIDAKLAAPSMDVEPARVLELLKAGCRINLAERNAAYDAGIAALRQQGKCCNQSGTYACKCNTYQPVQVVGSLVGGVASDILAYSMDEAQCWDAENKRWIIPQATLRTWAHRLFATTAHTPPAEVVPVTWRADPIMAGYAINGYRIVRGEEEPIARTIVKDEGCDEEAATLIVDALNAYTKKS